MSATKHLCNILTILAAGLLLIACENPTGSGSGNVGDGDITYEVGSRGPAGGLIFYVDDGNFYDDFDYLEAAPADWSGGADPELEWQIAAEDVTNTDQARGSGPDNTEEIITQSTSGTPAATAADTLEINGYADWFLPSLKELEEMKVRLDEQGLGGFEDALYWTSSSQGTTGVPGSPHYVLVEDFDPDSDAATRSATTFQRVRPVRAGSIE